MTTRLVCLIFLIASTCVSAADRTVTFTFKNESQHRLNWVSLVGAKIDPVGGVMSPGVFKTTVDLVWANDTTAKLTFVEFESRKPHSIEISFEEATRQIQAGKCRRVVVAILDYDKARVSCEN